jgi:YidC/Oxa1 family membrane protein insertase
LQPLGNNFGDIFHFHRLFAIFGGITQHGQTEGTANGQRLRTGLFGFAIAVGVDPLRFWANAMFFFFPNAIELRQESFWWAEDLSTYDEFIKLPFSIPFYGAHVSLFTLLMTISQIVYTHFNNQLTTATGPMKNLGYIMPVMFMFVLNSYPAGLSFYYFVSNIFTFGQQALIKLFVDDSKIREKVEENKLKNVDKKKSKFQQRLEDAMKMAEANKKK